MVRATSERGTSAPLAALEVVLCLVLFAACAVHVRARAARAAHARRAIRRASASAMTRCSTRCAARVGAAHVLTDGDLSA